jgi:hypothetical protein
MSQPTQVQYPWRSTGRTAFQVLVAAAAMWGLVVEAAGVDQANTYIAATVTAAAGVNRVMALPVVNDFIARFLPWLAAEPKAE